MYTNPEERWLVEQVLSGNRKAISQLVTQYERLVLHIVTPLIGANEDREDLCQDIFLKVFEKLHSFEFRSKLSTWIGNIAYNSSINFIKKKRNILFSELAMEYDEDIAAAGSLINEDPGQLLVAKEQFAFLQQAIDQLPPVQRTIILLFHYHDLSLDEISSITGDPVNTVKSHLFRARKKLKEKLSTGKDGE